MTIDENTRLDLRQAFEELIGPDLAHAAMEAMPPLDYNQFATKTDVDNLGVSLRAEISELRGELHTGLGALESSMELRLAKNLRATMLTQIATMAAFAGLITGLG